MRVPQTVKSAFAEPLNLLFVVFAFFVAMATEDPAVLFVAAAMELGYMLFVPDSGWYRNVLEGRALRTRQLERAKMKREILPGLLPQDRGRFQRLETMRNQLPNAAAIGFGREHTVIVCRQMDVLLDKFLQFGAKSAQYRAYLVDMVRPTPGPVFQGAGWVDRIFDLASVLITEKQDGLRIPVNGQPRKTAEMASIIEQVQTGLDSRIEQLKGSVAGAANDANRLVLQKNLEVVQKRRERIGELGNIITNLECQLDLIENTFGLISDQIRTLPPEQVLADINDVIIQTETTTQLLAAAAPVEFQLNRLDRTMA
ncbi:MAG TPA: hypothetical protein VGM37_04035 [Armatimonadota bacterium]|jgi:hypothetical protein